MREVNEARKEVEHDLEAIASDAYDAPFRDSIVLCTQIMDTHHVRYTFVGVSVCGRAGGGSCLSP